MMVIHVIFNYWGNLIVHLVIHLTLTYLSSFHFVIYNEMITRRSQKNLLQKKQIFFQREFYLYEFST